MNNDLNERWTDEVRTAELDLPLEGRASADTPWIDPLGDRLRAMQADMALLGRRGALHWLDVTERTLQDWRELDRVELVLDVLGAVRWADYAPRETTPGYPVPLPVKFPEVRMWEGSDDNTVADPYIDGFEAWAPLWSPLLEREFCAALKKVAAECPQGVGRDDLSRARRAVLGDLGVQLEGERLRAVIEPDGSTLPVPVPTVRSRL